MPLIVRLVFAVVALVVGNMIVPDGAASDAIAPKGEVNTYALFGGSVLIIAGAFVLARTIVTVVKARLDATQKAP